MNATLAPARVPSLLTLARRSSTLAIRAWLDLGPARRARQHPAGRRALAAAVRAMRAI